MASKALNRESNNLDHKDTEFDRQEAIAFGHRLRSRAGELGYNQSDLSRLAGIKKQSMKGYWDGLRLCGSEKLFPLSDALRVRARWLISGEGPRIADAGLINAEAADWVSLPRYDLRNLTDTSKGIAIESAPVRRDWLNRRLMISTGLWLTELPSDYDAIGLLEGDAVICSDIVPGDGPQEKWVCIFRGSAGPFVARYSNRPAGEFGGDEAIVTAADLIGDDVHVIARIHARMLAKL